MPCQVVTSTRASMNYAKWYTQGEAHTVPSFVSSSNIHTIQNYCMCWHAPLRFWPSTETEPLNASMPHLAHWSSAEPLPYLTTLVNYNSAAELLPNVNSGELGSCLLKYSPSNHRFPVTLNGDWSASTRHWLGARVRRGTVPMECWKALGFAEFSSQFPCIPRRAGHWLTQKDWVLRGCNDWHAPGPNKHTN